MNKVIIPIILGIFGAGIGTFIYIFKTRKHYTVKLVHRKERN